MKLLWISTGDRMGQELDSLRLPGGLEVEAVEGAWEGLERLKASRFAALVVSLPVPDWRTEDLLEHVQRIHAALPVILRDPQGTVADAVRLIKLGAYHFITGAEDPEHLVQVLDSAAEFGHSRDLVAVAAAVAEELWKKLLVGESRAMQGVAEVIRLVGPRRSTVLISGETGAGKELVARAIHMASDRAHQAMVAVNCSALPENLLEAELFGHVKGAFTGAVNHRTGRFEQAHRGTLLLDEVGDLPLEIQAKLLRVLQEREFSRVGGFEMLKANARIIAATNQDLEAAVAARRFREDLYFRLRVIPINLPPLRERREDIAELTDYFVTKAGREMGSHARYVSADARVKLENYSWPGNVRELENTVLRGALLAPGNTIRAEDVELGRGGARAQAGEMLTDATLSDLIARRVNELLENGGGEPRDLYQKIVTELEKPLIELALKRAHGNQVHAARMLGLNRNTLRKKLVEHRIAVTKSPG